MGDQVMTQQYPTVMELLRDRKEATGWSNNDFELASDNRLSAQTIDSMLNHPRKAWPKKIDTILGLADILHVDPQVIVLAWAAELGIPVTDNKPMLATRMPPGADKLTVAQQNAILALIRASIAAVEPA